MARPNYRRKENSDVWHLCTNCSGWPTINYDSSSVKPSSGEFCNECLSKERNNNCT